VIDGKPQLKHAPAAKKGDKNIKNVTRHRIADQQKEGKQGRDYSIKQFSIQPHSTYF